MSYKNAIKELRNMIFLINRKDRKRYRYYNEERIKGRNEKGIKR